LRDSLKAALKQNRLLYLFLTLWRSFSQERRIKREQKEYESKAYQLGLLNDYSETTTAALLRARLLTRGLILTPKPMGSLHIVYATLPNNWEPHNVFPALTKFGKVTPYYLREHGFDHNAPAWLAIRDRFERELVAFMQELHAREPVDAFVSYLSGWSVSPETIREIGALGIFTCSFHFDDHLSFRGVWAGGRWSGPAAVASAYDLNLSSASTSLVKYQVEGGVALFWPEAANPLHFRPLERPFEFDVSFVGACYGQRPLFIEYLRHHGIRVETFGPGWTNGPVSEEEMVEIYARSRINLGFGGIGYSMKAQHLKGRDFEVPMCGALYLTSDHPDIHLVYDVGREIVTYQDRQDCLQKIEYLLAHPEECAQIRRAARARCLRDHTWEQRFRHVFQLAGLLERPGE